MSVSQQPCVTHGEWDAFTAWHCVHTNTAATLCMNQYVNACDRCSSLGKLTFIPLGWTGNVNPGRRCLYVPVFRRLTRSRGCQKGELMSEQLRSLSWLMIKAWLGTLTWTQDCGKWDHNCLYHTVKRLKVSIYIYYSFFSSVDLRSTFSTVFYHLNECESVSANTTLKWYYILDFERFKTINSWLESFWRKQKRPEPVDSKVSLFEVMPHCSCCFWNVPSQGN